MKAGLGLGLGLGFGFGFELSFGFSFGFGLGFDFGLLPSPACGGTKGLPPRRRGCQQGGWGELWALGFGLWALGFGLGFDFGLLPSPPCGEQRACPRRRGCPQGGWGQLWTLPSAPYPASEDAHRQPTSSVLPAPPTPPSQAPAKTRSGPLPKHCVKKNGSHGPLLSAVDADWAQPR